MTEVTEHYEPIPGQTTIEEQIKETEMRARMNLQNKAYGKATTKLRENHREEFEKLVTEEYAAVGLVFKKRKTAEERAEQERQERIERARAAYTKLMEDNPEFREQLAREALEIERQRATGERVDTPAEQAGEEAASS